MRVQVIASARRRESSRAWRSIRLLLCFSGLAFAACVYDSDERCGPNQSYDAMYLRCVCSPGSALTEQGCIPCGANEVPGSQGCDCAEGFVRPSPDAACEAAPAGLGAVCDPNAAPCVDPTYDHCEPVASGGYCTNTDCTGSGDCQSGYACDTSVTPSVCRRPPLGQGQPCESATDCEGTEATYCDTFANDMCLVEGCTVETNDCFAGFQCCDLSMFNVALPICVPEGTCPL